MLKARIDDNHDQDERCDDLGLTYASEAGHVSEALTDVGPLAAHILDPLLGSQASPSVNVVDATIE